MQRKFKNQLLAILLIVQFVVPFSLSAQTSFLKQKNFYNFNGSSGDFNVNFKGDIKVAEDDKSITSISEGGFLEIEKKTFGNSRKLNIYPNSSGTLVYEYKEGSSKINFEPNGRKWMEEILPDVIRNTGIDIEGRVKRIYTNNGINGILNEIKSIESDFVASKYYRVLITQVSLTDSEFKLAIIALSNTVSSDFEKSNVLSSVSTFYISDNALTEAYLTTVSALSSDFEKSKVLKNLEIENLTENQLINYLHTTSTINSDFEKSGVLRYVLSKKVLTENTFLLTIKVNDDINSDFEKSKNYEVMLSKSPNENILTEIFNAARNINSDFEKGNVLKNAADNIKPSSTSLDAYFQAINSMNSDFEHAGVLKAIIKKYNMDEALYIRIFNSAAMLNADFEKSSVLSVAAVKMPKTDKVKEEFIKTAKTINSNFEYDNVMKAIKK